MAGSRSNHDDNNRSEKHALLALAHFMKPRNNAGNEEESAYAYLLNFHLTNDDVTLLMNERNAIENNQSTQLSKKSKNILEIYRSFIEGTDSDKHREKLLVLTKDYTVEQLIAVAILHGEDIDNADQWVEELNNLAQPSIQMPDPNNLVVRLRNIAIDIPKPDDLYLAFIALENEKDAIEEKLDDNGKKQNRPADFQIIDPLVRKNIVSDSDAALIKNNLKNRPSTESHPEDASADVFEAYKQRMEKSELIRIRKPIEEWSNHLSRSKKDLSTFASYIHPSNFNSVLEKLDETTNNETRAQLQQISDLYKNAANSIPKLNLELTDRDSIRNSSQLLFDSLNESYDLFKAFEKGATSYSAIPSLLRKINELNALGRFSNPGDREVAKSVETHYPIKMIQTATKFEALVKAIIDTGIIEDDHIKQLAQDNAKKLSTKMDTALAQSGLEEDKHIIESRLRELSEYNDSLKSKAPATKMLYQNRIAVIDKILSVMSDTNTTWQAKYDTFSKMMAPDNHEWRHIHEHINLMRKGDEFRSEKIKFRDKILKFIQVPLANLSKDELKNADPVQTNLNLKANTNIVTCINSGKSTTEKLNEISTIIKSAHTDAHPVPTLTNDNANKIADLISSHVPNDMSNTKVKDRIQQTFKDYPAILEAGTPIWATTRKQTRKTKSKSKRDPFTKAWIRSLAEYVSSESPKQHVMTAIPGIMRDSKIQKPKSLKTETDSIAKKAEEYYLIIDANPPSTNPANESTRTPEERYYKERVQNAYDQFSQFKKKGVAPGWERAKNDADTYKEYGYHTYLYKPKPKDKDILTGTDGTLIIREYDEDAYGLTKTQDFIDRARLIFPGVKHLLDNEVLFKNLPYAEKSQLTSWLKAREASLIDKIKSTCALDLKEMKGDSKLIYFKSQLEKFRALSKQELANIASSLAPLSNNKQTSPQDIIKQIKSAEKNYIAKNGRPNFIHIQKNSTIFNAQFTQGTNTTPSSMRNPAATESNRFLSNDVKECFGKIIDDNIQISFIAGRHSSYSPLEEKDPYQRHRLTKRAIIEMLKQTANDIKNRSDDHNLGKIENPIPISLSTMMLLTPRISSILEHIAMKGESEHLQVSDIKFAINSLLSEADENGIINLPGEERLAIKLNLSFMNIPVNAAMQPKKSMESGLKQKILHASSKSKLTEGINAKGFHEYCTQMTEAIKSKTTQSEKCNTIITKVNKLLLTLSQPDPNLDLRITGLKRTLTNKHKMLKDELGKTRENHEKNKVLNSYRNKINDIESNIDYNYKKLLALRSKKLGSNASEIKQLLNDLKTHLKDGTLTDPNDRELLLLASRFLTAQNVFSQKQYEYVPHVYTIPALYMLTNNAIGRQTEIFCKSAEDRTGWALIEMQAHELFYGEKKYPPDLDNKNDLADYRTYLQQAWNTSTSLANTKANSEASGLQISQSLTLPDEDGITIGKLMGNQAKKLFEGIPNKPNAVFVPVGALNNIDWDNANPIFDQLFTGSNEITIDQKSTIHIPSHASTTDWSRIFFDSNELPDNVPNIAKAAAATHLLRNGLLHDGDVEQFQSFFNLLERDKWELLDKSGLLTNISVLDAPDQIKQYLNRQLVTLNELRSVEKELAEIKAQANVEPADDPLARLIKQLDELPERITRFRAKAAAEAGARVSKRGMFGHDSRSASAKTQDDPSVRPISGNKSDKK